MSAKDTFHQVVKTALQKDEWQITHDPYPLQAGSLDLLINLGAEKVIAAERGEQKIAVEIKSFLGLSKISESGLTQSLCVMLSETQCSVSEAIAKQLASRRFFTPLPLRSE